MGLHPLVANVAFRSVYCISSPTKMKSAQLEYVLATDFSQACFDIEGHLPVFILAVIVIIVSIVGFPVGSMIQLARVASCFGGSGNNKHSGGGGGGGRHHQLLEDVAAADPPPQGFTPPGRPVAPLPPPSASSSASGVAEASAGDEESEHDESQEGRTRRKPRRVDAPLPPPPPGGGLDGGGGGRGIVVDSDPDVEGLRLPEQKQLSTDSELFKYGPVSGGPCCSCEACIAFLTLSRARFEELHNEKNVPEKFFAWKTFTGSDYKPEYFWVRAVFFASITLLGTCL